MRKERTVIIALRGIKSFREKKFKKDFINYESTVNIILGTFRIREEMKFLFFKNCRGILFR